MSEGTIHRDGDAVIVEVVSTSGYAGVPGVERIGKSRGKEGWLYRKVFRNKAIHLPDEYDDAIRANLHGKDVLVLAMNGYSRLTEEKCREWGIRPGAYEKACSVLLKAMFSAVRRSFPDVDIRFVHGASDLGVDGVIIRTAEELRRTQLGFSCPRFMMYVNDGDGVPVYVAGSTEAYAKAFVRSSDILVAANGRQQAFEMDLHAVFKYGKTFIPVNVLRLISTTGGPPAKNAEGGIEDAVAHYEQCVHLVGKRLLPSSADPWKDTVIEINEAMVGICRRILDPDIGLEVRS